MRKFHFFVEDYPDRKFLVQYSEFLKSSGQLKEELADKDISLLGGYSINEGNAKEIRKKVSVEVEVVLVVDADKSYDGRIAYYNSKKEEHALEFDIFLIPNGKDKGNAESIYETIAKRKDFWDCFDGYLNCLNSKDFKTTLPKSKIHAYNEATRLAENNRDIYKELNFLDETIWDLKNPILEPLKRLLQDLINNPK